MLKMVDGTGIIGVDMVCPLGGTVSPPQPPNFDKVEMEGVGSLMLPNSLEAPVERVELIGNSVQPTTTGKNLFDIKKASDASNYITTETLAKIDITAAIVFDVKKNTNYCLSVSGKTEQPSINFNIANDVQRKSIFNKLKTEETLNSLDSGKIYVGFSGGDTELNVTKLSQEYFDIQLEEASSKTPYEPYTGLKPSPSPEYPQEIKSVGRKSKNLLNLQKQPDVKETYLGWKVSNGEKITLSVTDKGNNADITGCYLGMSKTGGSSDGVVWVVSNGANAIKEITSTNQYVSVYPPNETVVQKLLNRFDIQVEYGGNATAYEPYGYLLDVKVTGKNLFNAEKAKDANNWTSSAILPSYKEFSIYVGKGNSVNISYLENLETGLGFYANIAHSKNDYTMHWLYHSDSEINITKNKNFIAMNDYIVLRVDAGSVPKFFEYIKTLQIEIGSKQTPYEPYTEQTLTLTSDRPITKWDKLVEQDGQIGWLYGAKEVALNGNELWEVYTDKKHTFALAPPYRIKDGFCTHYGKIPATDFDKKPGCFLHETVFLIISEPNASNTEEFKEILSGKVQSAKPIKVVCNTNLQYMFIPLSESEQTQLRNLHSYNGTTNIMVDSGEVECGIKLTYRKEI